MNKRNPYSVPPDYFEKLESSILDQIEMEQQPEPLSTSWGHAWKQLMGFAAAFALMAGIGWLFVLIASGGKQPINAQSQYQSTVDTARFLWVMSEQDVVAIVEHNDDFNHAAMAREIDEYIAFFGEADDVNLIYYD